MLVAVAAFSAMDAQLKLLSEHYAALQVAFIRGAAALPFVLLPIVLRSNLHRIKPVNVRLHLVRGGLAVLMLYSFVLAVRESSLATTYSIFMCAPLLVSAISVPMLGERVARTQWIAIAVGMAGVLLMLRPGGNDLFSFGAIAALVAVITYCFAVVTLRMLARTDTTESMVVCFTAMLALGAGILAIPVWRAIQWQDFPLMAGVGVTGALGQNFITQAFRRAPASVIAPFEYTALLWGVLLDLAIWHVLPDGITLVGGTIVIGAGLYLIERERRTAVVSEAAGLGPGSH
jgi:drug/metabolite transporter (DMT)-like permease